MTGELSAIHMAESSSQSSADNRIAANPAARAGTTRSPMVLLAMHFGRNDTYIGWNPSRMVNALEHSSIFQLFLFLLIQTSGISLKATVSRQNRLLAESGGNLPLFLNSNSDANCDVHWKLPAAVCYVNIAVGDTAASDVSNLTAHQKRTPNELSCLAPSSKINSPR